MNTPAPTIKVSETPTPFQQWRIKHNYLCFAIYTALFAGLGMVIVLAATTATEQVIHTQAEKAHYILQSSAVIVLGAFLGVAIFVTDRYSLKKHTQ